MPLTPFTPKCYQPTLSHGMCDSGHVIHLDVDHYDTPRWVHCLIVDLMTCPHEMADISGASHGYAGKHRAS